MTFNPAVVQQYRLIGFDNKKDALSDNSSSLEGGEIGSGSSTMAIFEIIPVKQNVAAPADQRDIAWVDLKYQKHTDTTHRSMQYQVLNNYAPIDSIDREYKFAAAVTMFGLKLKDSKFISKKDWLFIKNFSKQSVLPGNYLQQEYLNLVIKAQKIYDNKKRWGSN